MATRRVLIPDTTFDGAAIGEGLRYLDKVMDDSDEIRRCLLLIPTKASIQSTTLEHVLGTEISKRLRNGEAVRLGEGVLRLETSRTFKSYTPADAVIAVYADQAMMDAVDANRALKVVICVPHIPEAVDAWRRTWSPSVPGGVTEQVRLVRNPVVEAALASMTRRVNPGHRTLHPSDAEAVKEAFRILRAHGQTEDPASIRAWCIRHQWHAGAADEAQKHAAKAFASPSRPRVQPTQWAPDIYAQWMNSNAGATS